MLRKHVGYTLFRTSSLSAKQKSKIAIGVSLKVASASTSRKRCIVAGCLLSASLPYIARW